MENSTKIQAHMAQIFFAPRTNFGLHHTYWVSEINVMACDSVYIDLKKSLMYVANMNIYDFMAKLIWLIICEH